MTSDQFIPFDVRTAEARVAQSEVLAAEYKQERDQALAELEKLKRDIGWTMGPGKISDLIFNSDPIPASESGYSAPAGGDPADAERFAWINLHGRVCLGSECFLIALPHGGSPADESIPTPYNIRDIIDVCRRRVTSTPLLS